MAEHWVAVVHEYPMMGETRNDYGIVSALHDTVETAKNHLAYCEGMQAEGRPGSEGRYFLVHVHEMETNDG